jgi:pyruvate formate-lyase activating enzyme-like uncharacterized protein
MCRPNIHQILLTSSNEEENEGVFVTHMYTKIQLVNSEQMRPLVEVMIILNGCIIK